MKKQNDNNIIKIIILFIASIVLLVILSGNFKYIFTGKADDLNEMIADGREPKVRDTVSIDVQFVVDWYAELTTVRKGSKKVTYHCYAVLDNGKMISIGVRKDSDEYRKIDAIIEQTYEYLTGETDELPTPITLTGTIQKIDSEISGYYQTGLYMAGYNSSTDAYMLNIDTTQERFYYIILFVVAVGMFGFTGVLIVGECRVDKNKNVAQVKVTPVIPENDPIFNQAFYDLHQTNAENHDMEMKDEDKGQNDSNSGIDENDSGYSDDQIADESSEESADTQSKFTLKKD